MPHTLFISDLHLSPDTPVATETLLQFLRKTAPAADALYVLGDLFEYWIGDEGLAQPFAQEVARAFHVLTQDSVPVYFMHGNRDFLLGERFALASGMKLLPDPTLVDLHGTRTLLMHGDTLCSDDVEYQKFRAMVRNPAWQQAFLAKRTGRHAMSTRSMAATANAGCWPTGTTTVPTCCVTPAAAGLSRSADPLHRSTGRAGQSFDSPRARSALMSLAASRPAATRSKPSPRPAASRTCADKRPCVVLAGCVIVVLASPRLAVMEINWVASTPFHAASRPPFTSKDPIPPPVFCWRFANSCWGCDARPG